MAHSANYSAKKPKVFFVMSADDMTANSRLDTVELGPLAGPECFPEPSPQPESTGYGPAAAQSRSASRGYFLDRYIF